MTDRNQQLTPPAGSAFAAATLALAGGLTACNQQVVVETPLLECDPEALRPRTGLHAGRVLKTKRVGNGVKLFNTSGRFKLRIDASLARWQIKIEEISREDAKLYTPRNGG